MKDKPLIVIVGPTASGKTDLSVALALQFGGVCINADSTQLFNGLSIATNKIKDVEKQGVEHELLDILDLNEEFSVKDYQSLARQKIEQVWNQGKLPILVGGTGLYINAVLKNYHFQEIDSAAETRIVKRYESWTNQQLYDFLILNNIAGLEKIHPNNRKRVLRAIINWELNGCQNLKNKDQKDNWYYNNCFVILLNPNREQLHERIKIRVQRLTEEGLYEEVANSYHYCHEDLNKQSMQIIGVPEIVGYLKGEYTKEHAFNLMCQANRRYAKKQTTWFKYQIPIDLEFAFSYEEFPRVVNDAIITVQKFLQK